MSAYPAEYEYIDPSLLLDEYHPANSEFFKKGSSIQHAVVAQSGLMRPTHVEVVKLHVKGLNNVDVAGQVDRNAVTVGSILRRPDAKHLIELLRHYSLHLEGPSFEHRKRTLWEIAVDSQDTEPNVAIRAIHEMNHMDGIGNEKNDPKVEITINNQQLPRGALDV